MDTSTEQLVLMICIMTAAGFIQSVVSFGMGLLALPLLLQIGVPVPAAMSLMMVCIATQTILGLWQTRKHIPLRETAWAFAMRLVFTSLGILFLKELISGHESFFRLLVGLVLCGIVFVQWAWSVEPREHVQAVWGWLAFSLSGLMGGTFGMGGPPVMLWAISHTWTTLRIRAFLFSTFLLIIPLQTALLCALFGQVAVDGLVKGLMLIPAVVIGSLLGLPIGNRLPRRLMRILVYLLLLTVGGRMIVLYFT